MPSRRYSPSLWMILLLVAAILVPTTLAASRGDRRVSTRNTFNDRRAPKPVHDLRVASADASGMTLHWSPAWDNVGVEGYGVYLDGAPKSETRYTTYRFNDLVCGKGYTVGVDAFDDAGNRSRETSTFVSTAACGDVTAPSVPTGVHSVAATETSVILAWNPSSDDFGVVGYGLYVGGFWVGRWSEPSATITNLSCGQTYQLGINAVDAAGNESARTNVFFSTAACSDHTSPSTPAGVVVTKATQDTVSLSWTASTDTSGIAEYGLYRNGARVGATPTTSGQFTGLACGTTYTFGVDAANATQNRSGVASLSAATAPCSTTPPPTGDSSPTAPPNLNAYSVTQSTVVLRWDSSTDASGMAGYQIFRDGAKIGEGPGVHGGLTNQWTDRDRSCATTYHYAVAGVDIAGNVGAKSTLDVTTAACDTPPPPVDTNPPPPPVDTNPPPPPVDTNPPPPPVDTNPPPPTGDSSPTAPPNLNAYSVTQSTVVLRWDSSTDASGMAGYQIFRDGAKIGEGPGVHGGLTNQWTDRDRSCATTYHYAVAGVDIAGNVGAKSTLDVTTAACDTGGTTPPPTGSTPPPAVDTTAPTKPAGVTASTRTATSIAFTWQPSTDNVGVTGYGLYRGGSRVGTSTSATWIFSGLSCATSYSLGVDSVDAAGNRSEQAVVMVSTMACSDAQAPSTPSNLTASSVGQTSLTLGWSASNDNVGVTGYDVYRNGTKTATVTGLTSAQSGLTCGASYVFTVRALDAAGNTSTQAQLVVSTSACATQAPPPPPSSGPETISPSQFSARATSGATISNVVVTGSISLNNPNVTVQNATIQGGVTFNKGASGSKLINSKANHVAIWSADNILLDGNLLDGEGQVKDGITMWDQPSGDPPSGWVFRNNTFKNFYIGEGSDVHSQAIYVGYSTDGLIEGNTFTNNGTTSHIFFTWFGGVADPGSSWPRNICVRGNTFNQLHGAYYDVNFRSEIPSSAGIVIERDASSTSPQFYGSC